MTTNNQPLKFSITLDSKTYYKNCAEYMVSVRYDCEQALRDAVNTFASTAARETPPCIGKDAIERKLYVRPILNLVELKKRGRLWKLDAFQLKQGNHFKVLFKKDKKKYFKYYPDYASAKTAARIETRGLLKSMWREELRQSWHKGPTKHQAASKQVAKAGYAKLQHCDAKKTKCECVRSCHRE